MDKPIPAFYACYLLRSTIRHASLYVGSTPNPVRRLKQHNGEVKGGAVRTSRDSLRPWEMACLVTGFPSKIAALQFEWAWQNTHLTRHIPSAARLARSKQTTKSPKTGRVRRRPPRPRLCLTDRLANLHLLLRARSFTRWPLKVTFYAEDVWRVWTRWIAQHLELDGGNGLREGIWVGMDESMKTSKTADSTASNTTDPPPPRGIHALTVTHTLLKPHLEKTRHLLDESQPPQTCTLCSTALPTSGASTLVCPSPTCTTTTHLTCLASHFLASNKTDDPTSILPTTGTCPSCATPLQWQNLVQELSLRMRGEKELHALFKPARSRKRKAGEEDASAAVAGGAEEENDAEESESELVAEPLLDEDDEGWHHLSDSESELEEPAAVAVAASSSLKAPAFRRARGFKPRSAGPEVVVEDSDGDDVEIIA